ncbi:MAG: helix-turn-helix transcriptional regulator, partial [Elusimicrobia bacterium]|nr:helix-turn-helix transcriptional regulator [Elusimicrobiota bacterium]
MGILRSREELLPVTCAVLKEGDRESFFSDIRRKVGGNMDRVAKTVGVPVSTLQDWVNGTANIPYIALQRLASEFGVEMPSVTELRREYQQIVPNSAPRRPAARMPSHPGPVGGAGRDQERKEPRRESRRDAGHESGGREYEPLRPAKAPEPAAAPAPSDRPARKERGARRGRRGSEPRQPKAPRPERAPAPRPAAGPRLPKLSEEAAYWAGATIALGRRDGDVLVVAADKRIGQNYAATWAALCQDLFGVKATLSMSEDHACQEARLPVAGLEDFRNRLDLKPDAPRPPAPRWAWSNPDWKKAFLKGLVDASAEF